MRDSRRGAEAQSGGWRMTAFPTINNHELARRAMSGRAFALPLFLCLDPVVGTGKFGIRVKWLVTASLTLALVGGFFASIFFSAESTRHQLSATRTPSPLTSGWGLDAIVSRHLRPEQRPVFLDLLKATDIHYLRERNHGDSRNPEIWRTGEFATFRDLKRDGFGVVAFATLPGRPVGREKPNQLHENLLTVYAAAQEARAADGQSGCGLGTAQRTGRALRQGPSRSIRGVFEGGLPGTAGRDSGTLGSTTRRADGGAREFSGAVARARGGERVVRLHGWTERSLLRARTGSARRDPGASGVCQAIREGPGPAGVGDGVRDQRGALRRRRGRRAGGRSSGRSRSRRRRRRWRRMSPSSCPL